MEKRLFRAMVVAVLLALIAAMIPATAASKYTLVGQKWWEGSNMGYSLEIKNMDWQEFSKAKLVSIKSSNPHVIEVMAWGKRSERTLESVTLHPRFAGTSTVSLKFKYKGKNYSTSAKFTVMKAPNPHPLDSISLNGNAIDLEYDTFGYREHLYEGDTTKVEFKVNSKWKVTGRFYSLDPAEGEEGKHKDGKFTSGKAFNTPENYNVIVSIYLQNKKSGDTFEYLIELYR